MILDLIKMREVPVYQVLFLTLLRDNFVIKSREGYYIPKESGIVVVKTAFDAERVVKGLDKLLICNN